MPQAPSKPQDAPRRRLLVIDDNLVFARIVSMAGTAIGFEVEVTNHATEFKAAFLRARPDTICMDVVMPDINGLQLIQWLIEQRCRAKVVVATGSESVYAKLSEHIAIARGHFTIVAISKPMSLADLQAALA